MTPRQLSLASFGGDVAGGWCHFVAASAQGGCQRVLGGSLGMGGEPYPDMNQGFVFGPDGAGEAVRQFAASLRDRLLPGTLLALSTVAAEAAIAAAALDLPEEQPMALMCVHAADALRVEGRHEIEHVHDRKGLADAAEVLADAYELPLEWCANMMGERFLELEAADLFLARHGDRAVAAVGSARVAGTVTLGAVGTRRAPRHRGAASEALSAAIDHHVGEGAHLFGLVSVPGAEPLYAGLGFVAVDHLRGWLVPAP